MSAAVIVGLLSDPTLLRATFAGSQRGAKIPAGRVTLRPVDLREGRRLQVSRNDGRKDITSNHTLEELPAALADILAAGFSNIHITTTTEHIDLRLTKKGDLFIGRKKVETKLPASTSHNRPKNFALAEDDPFLATLGIADRAGRVRPTSRDKFAQINQFLKLLDHVLPEVIGQPQGDLPLTILDCGCGSSHLTLATAHFLNEVKRIPAKLIGIDANPEVIDKSRLRAANLGCPIEFHTAKIGALTDFSADIVLALHACDTATDDALAQAVRSHAKLVLAVPCCHNNLNAQLHIPALAPIHHHGILHQRQSDIITDTFRALLLEVMGYRAEVIEFISPEHTARNLMIRAVRTHGIGEAGTLARYTRFKSFAAVTPYLEIALSDLLPAVARVAPG